jgi:hypothetical protein
MDRAQVRGLLPFIEWMPYRYTRRQVLHRYEALQQRNVEDWEAITRHLGDPDRVPDLSIGFNGLLVMMHEAMFKAYNPETRRRAREVVSFYRGKHAQLFHAEAMLQRFDEDGVGNAEWCPPASDMFLEAPVEPGISRERSELVGDLGPS